MSLFKPTYTKPIPAGAKIITKTVKTAAGRVRRKFARFRRNGKSSETIDAMLTDCGTKCRVESTVWHIR